MKPRSINWGGAFRLLRSAALRLPRQQGHPDTQLKLEISDSKQKRVPTPTLNRQQVEAMPTMKNTDIKQKGACFT